MPGCIQSQRLTGKKYEQTNTSNQTGDARALMAATAGVDVFHIAGGVIHLLLIGAVVMFILRVLWNSSRVVA